ncbi:hypothetical protein BD410DRAFT_779733 [Rickenella mellea]|uniref:Uncharacterized protein n=1 Tax=Rickenella mellea TaxID=50990 RepID=A0A4R5XF11_9AGAM|nr:hypothetical protein BD410DRAFT_779733 [Rickenella mellea]
MDSDEEHRQELLSTLQAHGESFLSMFGEHGTGQKKKKRKLVHKSGEDTSSDEWHGFGGDTTSAADITIIDEGVSEGDTESGHESEGSDEHNDDEFSSEHHQSANVVVFSGAIPERPPPPAKAQTRAFMSSKVAKIRQDDGLQNGMKRKTDPEIEESQIAEERSNSQNDALLHKLVHTRLLSGSVNPELSLSPAQRKKALAGRVAELAGAAKLGKGEKLVRDDEHKHAAKKVRMGIERKKEDRMAKELEEAKNLGNYHHSIKGLFEASSSGKDNKTKREKGLKMGVGKFSGGMLKLSRDEIAAAQGSGSSRGRGRGRGSSRGGRSRGRGRGR